MDLISYLEMEPEMPACETDRGSGETCCLLGSGRYEIWSGQVPSHKGAHSNLYVGSYLVNSKVVALKLYDGTSPLEICFLRQVRAVPHANIIELLDDFTQPGKLWLVFPLLDMDLFAKWSFRRGRMGQQATLGYLVQA